MSFSQLRKRQPKSRKPSSSYDQPHRTRHSRQSSHNADPIISPSASDPFPASLNPSAYIPYSHDIQVPLRRRPQPSISPILGSHHTIGVSYPDTSSFSRAPRTQLDDNTTIRAWDHTANLIDRLEPGLTVPDVFYPPPSHWFPHSTASSMAYPPSSHQVSPPTVPEVITNPPQNQPPPHSERLGMFYPAPSQFAPYLTVPDMINPPPAQSLPHFQWPDTLYPPPSQLLPYPCSQPSTVATDCFSSDGLPPSNTSEIYPQAQIDSPVPHFMQMDSSSRHLPPQTGSSPFANAHHFTIGTANLYDFTQEDKPGRGGKVLRFLAARGQPAAMLESAERADPPRCSPETRRRLNYTISDWGEKTDNQKMFWLSGPAAVGKSAIAQTIAENFKKKGLLGAIFFFSRTSGRNDPGVVIPTLVYQLAIHHQEYQRIVIECIAKDPVVLTKNCRAQFEDLIIHPVQVLLKNCPVAVQEPLLIVVDGLDECRDRTAQCELVEMIASHAREVPASPLRWLICSRPESHLKSTFCNEDYQELCIPKHIEIEDGEAQQDAGRLLKDGFDTIRRKYSDQLTSDWPSPGDKRRIMDAAKGHLGFVSFLLRFVVDENYNDPSGQLNACLKFLEGSGDTQFTGSLHPLHALDLLYSQILSDIPPMDTIVARRIIGLSTLYADKSPTALTLANFLDLNQPTFYRSLSRLHSVLNIPSASQAHNRPVLIYHASFSDFLKDPNRSGSFVMNEGAVHNDVATQSLPWLYKVDSVTLPELQWIPTQQRKDTLLDLTRKFSMWSCWKAFPRVPDDCVATLINALEKVDFNCRDESWGMNRVHPSDFAYFIRWLYSLGPDRNNGLCVEAEATWPCLRISHHDDPEAFAAPFPKTSSEVFVIHLRLGKSSAIPVKLEAGEIPTSMGWVDSW